MKFKIRFDLSDRLRSWVRSRLGSLRLRPRLQSIALFSLLPATFLFLVLMVGQGRSFLALSQRLRSVAIVANAAEFADQTETDLEALRDKQPMVNDPAALWPAMKARLASLRQDQALGDAQSRVEDDLANLADAAKDPEMQATWVGSIRDHLPGLIARSAQAGLMTRDDSLARLGLAITWASHLPTLEMQLSHMRDLQSEAGHRRSATAAQRQEMLLLQRQYSLQMEHMLFELESAFASEDGLKARLIDDFGVSPFGEFQAAADRFAGAVADAFEPANTADRARHDYAAGRYQELRKCRNALEERLQLLLRERYQGQLWRGLFWALYLALGTAAVLATGLWLASTAAESVIQPLAALGVSARAVVQDHDLSHRAPEDGNDELAELGRDFNGMIQSLAEALTGLAGSTVALRDAANALQGAADDQAGSAVRQASALHEALVTGEELRQVARTALVRAKNVQTQALAAKAAAALGNESLREGEQEIEAMGRTLSDLQSRLSQLPERVERVDAVADSSKEIAVQTNVLALNAAIEALRAGNYGRSFGLVAAEMRSLADRSGGEAERVKSLLSEISEFTRVAVNESQAGGAKLSAGLKRVSQSAESFRDLAETAERNAEQAAEIGKAVEEQSTGLDQLFHALADQDGLMRQTEEAAHRVRNLVAPLLKTADELQASSARWKQST